MSDNEPFPDPYEWDPDLQASQPGPQPPEADPFSAPPPGLAWDDEWTFEPPPAAGLEQGWTTVSPPTPGWEFVPDKKQRSNFARHASAVAIAAAAAILVGGAGFGIGQTFLSNQSSTPSSTSAPVLTLPNGGFNGNDSSGSGGSSSGSGGTGSSGSTGSSSGSSGTSSGSSGTSSGNTGGASTAVPGSGSTGSGDTGSGSALDVAALASKVDPGIVDVNTTLAYQGGEAAGTGIVLTSNGEVLTNNHVIDGATSITVTDVGNGKTYSASVVGYDVTADIAILQLKDASGLTTVTLGDSSKVQVGAAVVALGNAGGQGGTPSVSSGTVTALNQSITASDEADGSAEQLTGLIQTSAALQPGDSGGPLVDVKGNVIGVDTATSVTGGRSRRREVSGGEAYAVPINTAISIAKQIEAGQSSDQIHIGTTAFLGVEMQPASDASGATVAGVEPNTAASEAGLQAGDVITSFGGKNVDSAATLSSLTQSRHAGDKVELSWTDASGNSHTATITLGSGPAR